MSQDQRYAAISVYMRGRYRPLEGPDAPSLAPGGGFASSAARDAFQNNAHLPEEVTRFLVAMDLKLDALLTALMEDALARDFPHPMDILTISAGGIRFTAAEPLAPGDFIELFFQITHPFFSVVSGIGQVVKKTDTPPGSLYDLTFTRLEDEAKEKIIRLVFHEERKILRKRLG